MNLKSTVKVWKYRSRKYRDLMESLSYTGKEECIKVCLDHVYHNRIEGDYLEFGTWTGKSFVTAYHFIQANGINKLYGTRMFGFDSFQGLPRINEVDKSDGFSHFEEGSYNCSVADFRKILTDHKVNLDEVTLIKGFFKDSLTPQLKQKHNIKKASLIMFDADLYDSTVEALDFVSELVQEGTIFIFDDYFCHRGSLNKGERRAFTEWLDNNPQWTATPFWRYGKAARAFIINAK